MIEWGMMLLARVLAGLTHRVMLWHMRRDSQVWREMVDEDVVEQESTTVA